MARPSKLDCACRELAHGLSKTRPSGEPGSEQRKRSEQARRKRRDDQVRLIAVAIEARTSGRDLFEVLEEQRLGHYREAIEEIAESVDFTNPALEKGSD